MDKASKIFILTILIVFAGILAYVSYSKSRLHKNGVRVSARIVDYNYGLKSVNTLTCEFTYNKKQYRISTGSSIPTFKWKKLEGRSFPAIYSPQSGMLRLLILREDFEEFDMPYPDSLAKWVNEHINM